MALDTFPDFSNAVKHDCATAVSSFFVKYSIDPRSVGRIEISTIHSLTDDLVSDVCGLFNSLDSGDIEAVVSRQAALSLLNAVNWVESKSWDGRFALVVIDDVNVVNSLLIGPNAPIILDPGYGVAWHNGETNVHGGSLDQSVFQKAVRQRSSKILGKGPESPSLNPPLEYIIFQGSNGRGESPQTLAVAQDVLSSVRDSLCVKDTKQAIEGSAVFSSLPELIGSKDLASNTAFGLFDIGERAVLFLVLRIAGDYSVMSQHLQHRIVEGYYSSRFTFF
ncbi:hypothetical protein DL96DRAFT_395113 [Flagelloscypha sp. PMI_526]|nr:hypothetical protein DL96DRAFT_395113 [Flagelloscypha sp. PMI_526]